MRVLTILARFGTDKYPHAQEQIEAIFREQMTGVDRTVVVVDNALRDALIDTRDRCTVIGGDNRAREFSAFDRAIDFVGSDIWAYDWVHFATSAFNTLYVDYLRRFDTDLLRAALHRSIGIGHIDCYNRPVEVCGYVSQHWIRSCFFFLQPVDVKALGSFVAIQDGHTLFTDSADAPFHPSAPISPQYQQYLLEWLTGADIGQGVTWHSGFPLTADTLPSFEHKALSIVNEHLLSVRLRAMGCRLTDVTWLAAMRAAGAGDSIRWDTSWREQLANRDRDAVVPTG